MEEVTMNKSQWRRRLGVTACAAVLAFSAMSTAAFAWPVRMIPGVSGIHIIEITGGSGSTCRLGTTGEGASFERTLLNPNGAPGACFWGFNFNDPALNIRLGPLTPSNRDFEGVNDRELYDVYYSDSNGRFDKNGPCISIEGQNNIVDARDPGFNIAFVGLSGSAPPGVSSYVSSSVVGVNGIAASAAFAADAAGGIATMTKLGSDLSSGEKMRVTTCWKVCEP